MSMWPPKKEFDFTYKRPEAKIHYPAQPAFDKIVPAFETGYSGTKWSFYDTEIYESETNGLQMVMFQRPMSQSMASYKHGVQCKGEAQTNMVQPSQLPQPYQFSLLGIAADFPVKEYPQSDLGDPTHAPIMQLREGKVRFCHAAGTPCLTCKLSDLPSLEELQKKPIPDWFMRESEAFLESVVCRHMGTEGKKAFPTHMDRWLPGQMYRHIQANEAFQVVLEWDRKIPVICPIKISLYGIFWFPR
jgi:hypothetical protein